LHYFCENQQKYLTYICDYSIKITTNKGVHQMALINRITIWFGVSPGMRLDERLIIFATSIKHNILAIYDQRRNTMKTTVREVLEFVAENDVKFIRLAFCDLFGRQKNISIMPDELELAFEEGISFDASAIKGFSTVSDSDLFLFPDPTTLMVLPWRPQQGRVVRFYCDIRNPDGTSYESDTRSLLKAVVAESNSIGFSCQLGAECEFYLFATNQLGEPTLTPVDNGSYLDIAPLDKGENVRREICLNLEELGLHPERSHHEQGPGQNEIDFQFSDPLASADNLLTLKSTVRIVAERNGFYSSFLPKPLKGMSGNGMHVNLSIANQGQNLFASSEPDDVAIAESFIAGILEKIAEMTIFLNPIPNSYERFGSFEAPQYVSWSRQNRSQLIRIPAAAGHKVRMELRSPDPSANPYLAFALIISAGLEGIQKHLTLPPALNENLFEADQNKLANLERLPGNMKSAIELARNSTFIERVLGMEILNKYLDSKVKEEESYMNAKPRDVLDWEQYFLIY
jgi:glutamine synthetase